MLRKLASFFTYIMRHYLPDAYLFAILLTFLSGILALSFTPSGFMKLDPNLGRWNLRDHRFRHADDSNPHHRTRPCPHAAHEQDLSGGLPERVRARSRPG